MSSSGLAWGSREGAPRVGQSTRLARRVTVIVRTVARLVADDGGISAVQ
ncbi:MAG TPA: hypothetical protein VGQ05_05950 [Streptosporangiaceae bacterium]|nr:hypothetical protein [Streptosporangiaceae bacterium]